jgi:hypothetical protein
MAVSSWAKQVSNIVGGRPDESLGTIPEACRRMPGYGQIRAIPGEQSYMGRLDSEMGSVR